MKRITLILLLILAIKGYADPIEKQPNAKVLSRTPRIYLIQNFLSSAECDHIIKEASNKLSRSLVIDLETGEGTVDTSRTSHGMDFQFHQDPILQNIQKRIATYTQIPEEYREFCKFSTMESAQNSHPILIIFRKTIQAILCI